MEDAIRARCIVYVEMQVEFSQSNLAGRAKSWALGLKLHDLFAFGSLEVFKTRLKQMFEPPRAGFRALSEFLKLKQGKRGVHAYAQHTRFLSSCVTANQIDEHTLVTVFIQGLTDGPIKTHLFRLKLEMLDQAISVAEQEDFCLRQAQASSFSYLPSRRQEIGGPEPMDLCYVESERTRSAGHKRLQRCNRCQKTWHYPYECSAPNVVPRTTVRDNRPSAKKGPRRGSDAVAKPQQRGGPSKKRSGSVRSERPADPETSREFARLLSKVAPNTQSMCVTAPGDEVTLITLKIEVTNQLSLRALVDCGASNNFIRRRSLENRRLKHVDSDIPVTRMKVRLATGASVTVMKRVVVIHYTLKDKQYDEDFIVLDLDDKFDVILGIPWLRKYEPKISWQNRSVKMPAACSSDGHLTNVLERLQACGCTTSDCDGLTCGTVVSTTAQDHSVTSHHNVEPAAGGCAKAQAAPKVQHSNKSSGPGHECLPRGPHPRKKKPVATEWQNGNLKSTRKSTVEDLAVLALTQLENVQIISPCVLESQALKKTYC